MEVIENLSEKALYDYNLVRRAVDSKDQKAYAELIWSSRRKSTSRIAPKAPPARRRAATEPTIRD